jgi:putative tricarboxylic transport membrane protein
MRRLQFLSSLLSLSAAAAWPGTAAGAGGVLQLVIPANRGGGWDSTGRALGRALVDIGAADSVRYEYKGGAAGAIGLDHFVHTTHGNPQALLVMGAVMLGGIITGKPPVALDRTTPVARLTHEHNVVVVPAASPWRSMKDVVAQMARDPASVKWGGGSRGATEHIAAAMIARAIGLDAGRLNYIAFRGGGEATAAILSGLVGIGGSGYSEFAPHIASGRMRPLAVTAETRLPGLDVPTLKEQGLDVVVGNWRGVYGAPGLSGPQRQALTDQVIEATRSPVWADALQTNGWLPSLLTGPAFDQFVTGEFHRLRGVMSTIGLIG